MRDSSKNKINYFMAGNFVYPASFNFFCEIKANYRMGN